ncbi:endonuclease/exonuclease/phosphatase family protein [uncultured Demequina sp.]|uniref:endonuclease/exonuclease/phosphatase family protein n=1 Tax=uncultured Demequina sp. TaxID=693499 RepID=UPI0025F3C48F|nr:endonuclease/exonuclease/phosphatase family protein [uncultured Demequina sp.]
MTLGRDDAVAGWQSTSPARRPRRVRVQWRGVARALGWVVFAPTLAVVAARELGFEAGPFAVLVALTPWALAGFAASLVCAAAGRSALLAGVSVLACVPVVFTMAPVWSSETLPGGPHALTVASVSMTFGEAEAEQVVALVRDRDVDLLAIQELTPEAQDALVEAGLEEELPYAAAYPEPGFTGTGLWSREPLAIAASLDGFVARTAHATLGTGDGAITVIAPHPAAPGLFSHEAWSADTESLIELLEATPGPAIVVGDLNLTSDHRAFRDLLDAGYSHARDQAGVGPRFTFPESRSPFPLVAIDHVLVRDVPFSASAVETVAITGSDHRALLVNYTYTSGES